MSKIDNLGNVLIRSDLNVPIKNGEITDNFRILKSVEILESILDKSRTITFTSHMGRPNGKDLNLSLRPVAENMSDFLGKEVRFIEEVLINPLKIIFLCCRKCSQNTVRCMGVGLPSF